MGQNALSLQSSVVGSHAVEIINGLACSGLFSAEASLSGVYGAFEVSKGRA